MKELQRTLSFEWRGSGGCVSKWQLGTHRCHLSPEGHKHLPEIYSYSPMNDWQDIHILPEGMVLAICLFTQGQNWKMPERITATLAETRGIFPSFPVSCQKPLRLRIVFAVHVSNDYWWMMRNLPPTKTRPLQPMTAMLHKGFHLCGNMHVCTHTQKMLNDGLFLNTFYSTS